jgi:hypothetical protein
MNAKLSSLILFAAAPLAAAAASPSDALTVDCARLPSQRTVAEFTGIANFGHAYAERERLMSEVRRACKPGVRQVRLVRETRANEPNAALAAAP